MNQDPQKEVFEALVSGYLDAGLSVEEEQELLALLKSNPSLEKDFMDWAEFDQGLTGWLSRPPAEDAAVDAICRKLALGRPRRRTFPVWARLATAASILACVGLVWIAVRGAFRTGAGVVIAEVVEQRSAAYIEGDGKRWSNLAVGDKILAGMSVRTGADGRLRYRYVNEDTVITVRKNSLLKLERPRLGHLANGHLIAAISKQIQASDASKKKPGKPFVLTTPQAEVTVLGTKLQLTAAGKTTRLAVTKGLARLASRLDDQVVQLRSGEYAVVVPGQELVVKALPTNVVYQSDFTMEKLDAFWETATPAKQVTVGALETTQMFPGAPKMGQLTLKAAGADTDYGRTNALGPKAEIISRPVSLDGEALEILIPQLFIGGGGRSRADAPPSVARLQLLHGRKVLCSLEKDTGGFQRKSNLYFGFRKSKRRIAISPWTTMNSARFVIAPEGNRLAVRMKYGRQSIIRPLPEPIDEIQFRLITDTIPTGYIDCRLPSFTIRRLPDWPEELSGSGGSMTGTVFEDDFEGPRLSGSWQCKQEGAQATANGVEFDESWLLLQAGKSRGKKFPDQVEILSAPIAVKDRRLNIFFEAAPLEVTRQRGGEYGVELLDQDGKRICLALSSRRSTRWWDQKVLLPEGTDESAIQGRDNIVGHVPYLPDIDITPSQYGVARFSALHDSIRFKTGKFETVRLRLYVKAAPKTHFTVPIDKIVITLTKPYRVKPPVKTAARPASKHP